MLFRPVYGPELEAIYKYTVERGSTVSKQDIYQLFLPQQRNIAVSTQNIDDALTFLVSCGLLTNSSGFTADSRESEPFRLLLLRQLRRLATGSVSPRHEVDPLYLLILDELFIRPNRLYVEDVHDAANALRGVVAVGGLSQEKIRSWSRVMSFLGVGHRIGKGFQCAYAASLLYEILETWRPAGLIQVFLEEHATNYLPFYTDTGTLAVAAEEPLLHLERHDLISMTLRQDVSNKPYFGERRLRYLSLGRETSG